MPKTRFAVSSAALAALLLVGTATANQAQAQSARISMTVAKAGFVFGVSTGSGTLRYRGRGYRLSIGGVRLGLTVGASNAKMYGEVYNLHRLHHIEGTYGAVQASATAGSGGGQNWVLENARGVRLVLRGRQKGLEASLDAGGIVITLD